MVVQRDPDPRPWWWLSHDERVSLGLGAGVQRTAHGFVFGDIGARCRIEVVARDESAPVKLGSASLRVWGDLDDANVRSVITRAARILHARRGRGFEPEKVAFDAADTPVDTAAETVRPPTVIDVPSVCDRACSFCGRSLEPIERRRVHRTDHDVYAEIDRAEGDVLFTGDDAMSHSHIVDFVERAASRRLGRVTGIGPLRESHARQHGEALARAGLVTWSTGLFGGDAGSHDRVAGLAGAFDTLVAATAVLRGAGIAVRFVTPLVRPVIAELPAILARARELTGAAASLLAYVPDRDVGEHFDPIVPRFDELRAALDAVGDEAGGVDALPICALPFAWRAQAATRLDRTDPSLRIAYPAATCDGCEARPRCPGVADTVLRANGGAGLVTLSRR
jgi:hypothetical protein